MTTHSGARLDAFGITRLTTLGPLTAAGVPLWEDRITVSEEGRVLRTIRRSLSDMPGARVGTFELEKGRSFALSLAALLKSHPLRAVPPSRVEPNDVAIQLSATIDGAEDQVTFSARDEEAARAVEPIAAALRPLILDSGWRPQMSLGLEITAPRQAALGDRRVTVSIVFSSDGAEGFWLTHPSQLAGGDNRCELQYGWKVEIRDDIMPEPVEVLRASLTCEVASPTERVWMAPGSRTAVPMTADVHFARAGDYFMRAGYCAYIPGPVGERAETFVGGVFSADDDVGVS